MVVTPGSKVVSEPGALLYMSDDVTMETTSGAGITQAFRRILSGESFFVNTYVYHGSTFGYVAFASPHPGKILPLDLRVTGPMLCQSDAFLCGMGNVDINVHVVRELRTAIFGGEGFFLQRLTGDGTAFVNGGGTVIEKKLGRGEVIKLDSGCLVAFTESVSYEIQYVGRLRSALFGGEGIFFTKMTGPGVVYIQSLPVARLAMNLQTAGFGQQGNRANNLGNCARLVVVLLFLLVFVLVAFATPGQWHRVLEEL
eukprot:GILJ01005637.1.p1 GENE.GILJ01005637.1~~GILJ01005637.1.p1  ORF type:complete len:290 (+),score=22.20 GILJ01005637.1:108-872(+)